MDYKCVEIKGNIKGKNIRTFSVILFFIGHTKPTLSYDICIINISGKCHQRVMYYGKIYALTLNYSRKFVFSNLCTTHNPLPDFEIGDDAVMLI